MKKTHKMPHRRVREQRTDYRARLKLLKSGKVRFIVRKSANNMVCQVVKHEPKGDKTIVSVGVKALRDNGWKGHGGSIPTAYLIGFLCGSQAKKSGIKSAVVDLGIQTQSKGSRLYATVKGAVDAGLDIPHSNDIFPSEDRLSGKHISQHAEKLKKEDEEKYKKLFSGYLKNKLNPETLPKHFEEIKKKISAT